MTFFTISPQSPSICNFCPFHPWITCSHAVVKDFNESLFSRRVKNFDIKVDTGGGDYRQVWSEKKNVNSIWLNLSQLDLTRLDLTWLDLTWLDLTWLDLTWLDSTWLNSTWLDSCNVCSIFFTSDSTFQCGSEWQNDSWGINFHWSRDLVSYS